MNHAEMHWVISLVDRYFTLASQSCLTLVVLSWNIDVLCVKPGPPRSAEGAGRALHSQHALRFLLFRARTKDGAGFLQSGECGLSSEQSQHALHFLI